MSSATNPELPSGISSKHRILPFPSRRLFQSKRHGVFNREIEGPFEFCEILVVVNKPIYHAPDETFLVHAIGPESRFERGQGCAVNPLTE